MRILLAFRGKKVVGLFIYENDISKLGLRVIDYSPITYRINPISNPNPRLNIFTRTESLTE